jgi:hypothetical protein
VKIDGLKKSWLAKINGNDEGGLEKLKECVAVRILFGWSRGALKSLGSLVLSSDSTFFISLSLTLAVYFCPPPTPSPTTPTTTSTTTTPGLHLRRRRLCSPRQILEAR